MDIKKLLKRFRTLEEDLQSFVKSGLAMYHQTPRIDYGGIVQIVDLEFEERSIFKVRKFACRALKGRGVQSGIRITYAYYQKVDRVEFIEIYFKGDKENEDRERIKRHYAKQAGLAG